MVFFMTANVLSGKTQDAIIVVDAQKGFAESQEYLIEGIKDKQTHGLVVADAKKIVGPINSLIEALSQQGKGLTLLYSGDFHPTDHIGFYQLQKTGSCEVGAPMTVPLSSKETKETMQWPWHCVQGTAGCDFIDGLKVPDPIADELAVAFVQKGTKADVESYSCITDEDGSANLIAGEFQDAAQKTTYASVNLDGNAVEEDTSVMDYLVANVDFNGGARVIVTGLALDFCVKSTAESVHKELEKLGLREKVQIIVPRDTSKHAINDEETISHLKSLDIEIVDKAEDLLQ